MAPARHLAVDLGASSGRVLLGTWDGARLGLEEVHRFPNGPVRQGGRLSTDFEGLWEQVRRGVAAAGARLDRPPDGLGVDTWGVDFGLLGADGTLQAPPVHYRDARTNGIMQRVFAVVPRGEIFRRTGIQFMQINTLYQLFAAAAANDPHLESASRLLFTPDLFHWRLTGEQVGEYTIASTSQMLDAAGRCWAGDLLAALGLPTAILPPLVPPGTILGELRRDVAAALPWGAAFPVIAVGSHDTASAVAAVPDLDGASAYLSSGTWSLMGLEVREPVINDLTLALNFTNEGGVAGTIRLLKNIAGLWPVQECRAAWERDGRRYAWDELWSLAESAEPFRSLVDPDAPEFLSPGDMPAAVRGFCRRAGQPEPDTPGRMVRCLLEGLALKYRIVFGDLERLAGRRLEAVRIVGGGAQNRLLNQFTADACGRPVVAGPAEATALGNVIVQLIATGRLANLAEGRRAVAASVERVTYSPRATDAWEAAGARFLALGTG